MEFSYRISESDSLRAWKLRREKHRWPLGLLGFGLVLFWVFILVCLMLLWTVVQKSATSKAVEYSYSDLYNKVQAGEVQDAVIQGDELRGHLKGSPEGFHTTLPANYDDLLKAMIAARMSVTIRESKGKGPQGGIVFPLLVTVGPIVLVLSLFCLFVVLLGRFGATAPRSKYREDPVMQGEFSVEITPQGIATRNTAGTSAKSGWNIYEYWREGKGLTVLVLRSGAYFTLNVAGLSDVQRQELRGILATALPKK